MLTLTRCWKTPLLKPVDSVPLLINKNHTIVAKGGRFFVDGNEEQTLNKIEISVYYVLVEQINAGVEKLSDTQLAALVCIKNCWTSNERWEKIIEDLKVAVKNIDENSLPSNRGHYNIIQTIYNISGRTGEVAKEAEGLLLDCAAHSVVVESLERLGNVEEAFEDKNNFIETIWAAIFSLIEKKLFYCSIHLATECKNSYFMSDKMLFVKLLGDESCVDLSELFSKIDESYPDAFTKRKTETVLMYERHPDHIVDFNLTFPTSGGISLTQDCQLRCQYCSFSSGDCNNKTLSIESIKLFVDMLVRNVVKKRLVTKHSDTMKILIAGGGEPTYKWKTFVSAVDYIKHTAKKHNIPLSLEITTNGCHSEEQTNYIIENFDRITISFDGMPETQNKNRPFANGQQTFDVVDQTIRRLDAAGVNYTLLSVVQPDDFYKMREMAAFVFGNYPNVVSWTVRPPIAIGRAISRNAYETPETGVFTDAYFDAISRMGFPRKINCGIFVSKACENFCGALYGRNPWLIADDIIVTCQDAHDKPVVIGKIENGEIRLEKNMEIYAKKTFESMVECQSCIAYQYCKGDCPLKDSSKEMKMYSSWKCFEIESYWQKILSKLDKTGYFDGWYLQRMSFDKKYNVMIYKLRK